MSGIVAMFSDHGDVHFEGLARATRALRHRGPDDTHHWIDAARSAGLGVCGNAPAVNEDESIRVALDGALCDFDALSARMTVRGHRPRSGCDAELVAHLYEEYGTACIEHLRGEFAFVVHDARRDLLIAARDRFGIKPLVYGCYRGVWMFASEAKALLDAGFPAAWDRESFLHWCALGSPAEDRTMFAGILQVPPGHMLIASRGHRRLVRYWDLDYPFEPGPAERSEHEDREALVDALADAVRERMRASGPVACYLSGGLDSCTVLGLAQRYASAPIRAFTLALAGSEGEDVRAREMAARAGAAYTEVTVRKSDIADVFEDAVYFAERPIHNANSPIKFLLSRAASDAGAGVVLTGDGADEIFAGYPHYHRDLAERRDSDAPSSAPPSSYEGLSLASVRAVLGGTVPSWTAGAASAGRYMAGLLRPEFGRKLVFGDPLGALVSGLEVSRQLRGRHPLHQAMYLWTKVVLPGSVAPACDRMDMAHSIEARLPFLDHRVVELSARLPIDRLIRGDVEKYLLREAAHFVITDAIYHQRKQPLAQIAVATANDTAAPLDELLHDTLRGDLLRACLFFRRRRVIALLDSLPTRAPAMRVAFHNQLTAIASICLLQRRFGIDDAN